MSCQVLLRRTAQTQSPAIIRAVTSSWAVNSFQSVGAKIFALSLLPPSFSGSLSARRMRQKKGDHRATHGRMEGEEF